MTAIKEYQNLCVSCEKASTCEFIRDPRRSAFVVKCEDFKPFSHPSKKNTPANFPWLLEEKFRSVAMEKDPSEYMGLCKNCNNRQTCTFPKPEGGVWECEEYQ